MYYYREDLGFLSSAIHDNIPEDAIEITDEYHAELFEGQCNSKSIVCVDGFPVLVDDEVDEVDYSTDVRKKRNKLLRLTDWSQLSDVPDELQKVYKEYRQELRDLTEQEEFPHNIKWPKPPEEL